ncbi:ubiquitin-like protein, partial [Pluteus cervinus]
MSQEPQEDTKPKLNLNITFDGNQITVKVKANMKFSKIFEAAEKRFTKDSGTLRFTYDGSRIGSDETPASLGMEDGDQIDAFLGQVGGSCKKALRIQS